jgi:hypothetical protein
MGFHPDAGASFYLSRLPGYLGEVYFSQFTYQEYIYILCTWVAPLCAFDNIYIDI